MESDAGKTERIELRVSSSEKEIFQRAQKLSGDKSFSSFIVRVVKEKSEEILARNNQIIASEKDRQIFIDAVFNNLKPHDNLVDAVKRYKSRQLPF